MTVSTAAVKESINYVNGFQIAKTGAKTLSMAAGKCRERTDRNHIVLDDAVTLNGGVVGYNGVDLAVLAANTLYAVYAITDTYAGNPAGGIMSTDFTQPLLPLGYNVSKRVGWVFTDGSADILEFHQYGDDRQRNYYLDAGVSVLSGGSDATFTEVDLTSAVPPISTEVVLDVAYTPDGATDLAEFLPFGSSATDGIVRFGYGVAGLQVGMGVVPSALDGTAPKILYKVTAGDSLTLLVKGFTDYL